MSERRGLAELIGEGLRESGVLIAVFGMLDKFLRSETPTVVWTIAVLSVALIFFGVGCTIEIRRH